MASTKEISLFLNFKQNTPQYIIDQLNNVFNRGEESFLTNGFRHACGKPTFEFYLDEDREQDYHLSDGTYYLRYCNVIKDYDNLFEQWLNQLAPYIIQVNGVFVGTVLYTEKSKPYLITVEHETLSIVST